MKRVRFAGHVRQQDELSPTSSTVEAPPTQHVCAPDLNHPAAYEPQDVKTGLGMRASTLTTDFTIPSLRGRTLSSSTLNLIQISASPGGSNQELPNPPMHDMGARSRLSTPTAISSTKPRSALSTSSAAPVHTNGSVSTTTSETAVMQLMTSEVQQSTNHSATEFSSLLQTHHVPVSSSSTGFCSISNKITTERLPVLDRSSGIAQVTGNPANHSGPVRSALTHSGGTTASQNSLAMIVYTGGQQAALDTHGTEDCRLFGGANASVDTTREELPSARQLVTLPLLSNNTGLSEHNYVRFSGDLTALSQQTFFGTSDRQSPSRDETTSTIPRNMSRRLTVREATATTSSLPYTILEDAAATSGTGREAEQRSSDRVVISAAQAANAVRRLELETERSKALESTVRNQQRDRVVIYDAAMKQAAKREEAFISEAKQTLQREQSTMRAEVDKEMGKIHELYEERCRDYGQMVSDGCEGEVSKKVADLRKDWARQKKTIAQLVKEGEGDDRQVAVIAKAVMEQLGEERKEETEAIRAEIYADVKAEFEARFEAMQGALQSEHQTDLEGQLLLAEIEHQKGLDRLRTELTRDAAGIPSSDATATSIVLYQPGASRQGGGADESAGVASNPYRCTPSPSVSRRVGMTERGNASGGRVSGGGGGRGACGLGRRGLVGKLPAFKMPTRKHSPGDDNNERDDGKNKKAAKKSPKATTKQPRGRMKKASRPTTTEGKRSGNAGDTVAVGDALRDKFNETSNSVEEGITSALMVSPTKSVAGIATVTPSVDATTEEPPRPKKRGKKLFAFGS